MPITIECPRCKTPLRLSKKMAGAYVHCPHCKVRLWVARNERADAVGASSGGGTPEAGDAPAPQPPAEKPKKSAAIARVSPVMPPVQSPPKKVARFITAEAADSTLRLAADGKLPALHLEEDSADEKSETKSRRSVNPLIMFGMLGLSVVLSVVFGLMDWDSQESSGTHQRAAMRQKIEDDYFGSDNIGNQDLEPYQLLLRQAQRAYTRGDYKTESEKYCKVLEMLRTERDLHERGLTGSRTRDKELKEAIRVLLSGG